MEGDEDEEKGGGVKRRRRSMRRRLRRKTTQGEIMRENRTRWIDLRKNAEE